MGWEYVPKPFPLVHVPIFPIIFSARIWVLLFGPGVWGFIGLSSLRIPLDLQRLLDLRKISTKTSSVAFVSIPKDLSWTLQWWKGGFEPVLHRGGVGSSK